MCFDICIEDRGQFYKVTSQLPSLHGFKESNSGLLSKCFFQLRYLTGPST